MAEKCARCGISEEKARLFDAIYEGKMAMLCERCAIIENIPIIKKPNVVQLKASEKNIDVYERMKRLSGYKEPQHEEKLFREQRLRELDKNPNLELPIQKQLNLIEHFHWEIMKSRRRKGLSHKQLAEAIGESEIAIDMLEKGKLPENSEPLIKKLEQFFQINLKKITEAEAMVIKRQKMLRTKPVLLDEDGNELEHIPEPELEHGKLPIYLETHEVKSEKKEVPWYKKILGRKKIGSKASSESLKSEDSAFAELSEEPIKEKNMPQIPKSRYLEYRRWELMAKAPEKFRASRQPAIELKGYRKTNVFPSSSNPSNLNGGFNENEDLELEKIDISKVRIGDLKEIHKKKIETTKQERKEEQKKIEEKQRLIEARKEELRSMKEKESKELDSVLGGAELFSSESSEYKG